MGPKITPTATDTSTLKQAWITGIAGQPKEGKNDTANHERDLPSHGRGALVALPLPDEQRNQTDPDGNNPAAITHRQH